MNNRHSSKSIRRHALALALLLMPPCCAMAASVSVFSPQGKISDVLQVRASFDEAMLPLGTIDAPDPFTIACPMRGRAHWIDQKNWVWDIPPADPEGQSCTFTLRDNLKTLSGKAITGKRVFGFELPALTYNQRIRMVGAQPYNGSTVRTDQLFVVVFDHPIQSPRPALYCISGDSPRQPVEVHDADQQLMRKLYLAPEDRSIAIRCPGPLAEPSHLRLLLDRGPGRDVDAFNFSVRGPAGASVNCVAPEDPSTCLPTRPITLSFNSAVSERFLRDIRLETPAGPKGGVASVTPERPFSLGSSEVTFNVKLEPEASYKLSYPANMVDADGRPVSIQQLPSEIRTSHALAVVGFQASNIALIRRSKNTSLQMLMDHHPKPAHLAELVVGNQTDVQAADQSMLQWLDSFETMRVVEEFHDHPGPFKQTEVQSDSSGSLTLPLQEPGLHVFVTAQRQTQEATDSLLQDLEYGGQPEFAGAIATSMAVIFKTSQENGAVWVTSLDDAKPIAGAKVRIYDDRHTLVWQGDTDGSGLATIPVPMSAGGLTAIVRATDSNGKKDLSVTRSGWDDSGISNMRYRIRGRHAFFQSGIRADSIMDRTLVKPGEKVSMRTVMRSETSSGLAYLNPASRPRSLRILHSSSGQHWDFPLKWDHAGDALTTFEVPVSAPLGEYTLWLLYDSAINSMLNSGNFSVEAYRVPSLTGEVSLAAAAVLAGSTPTVSINLHYQDGSPAAGLPVKVSATLRQQMDGGLDVEGFEETASPRPVATGFWPQDGKSITLTKQQLTLDKDGKAAFTLPVLPRPGGEYTLHLEASFLDTSGEVQTLNRTVTVRRSPLRLQVGIFGGGNVGSPVEIRMRAIGYDDSVRANEKVSLRAEFIDDNRIESRTSLGTICSAVTDATGTASCFYKMTRPGHYLFIASSKDELGHEVESSAERWALDSLERAKDLFLGADKQQYQPGDVAHIRVTTPFDVSRAWLSVEREGVIDSKIITLTGPNCEIEVPIDASYGPNVFVSLLAIPSTGNLEEGDLPPHASGTISLGVARDNNTLKVSVATDSTSYAPNQTAQLRIHVTTPDGTPASGPLRASLAVVDEALLDLKDNSSWNLLDLMMQHRADGVNTSTPLALAVTKDIAQRLVQLQNEVLQRLQKQRRFDAAEPQPMMAPAPAPLVAKEGDGLARVTVTGSNLRRADTEIPSPVQVIGTSSDGGGKTDSKRGSVAVRKVTSSLLFWQPDVLLDANGEATVPVPIGDALSRFRVVAVASAGNQQFGTGSAQLSVTKDVQIVSGLAPVVREGDSLKEIVTLRSRASRALQLDVSAQATGLGSVLTPNRIALQPGESKDISFDFTVPKSAKPLQFEITALESGHPENGDRLAVEQKVLPSIPVEVVASTFDQIKPTLEIPVAAPPGSLSQSAHVEVALQARFAQPMPGVMHWMQSYPYHCIEQRTSIALATHDKEALRSALSDLPKYLDADGLVNYFPTDDATRREGSDVLTAYLLNIAQAYGVTLPEAQQVQMLQALARFARGELTRQSWAPRNDSMARRLAAIAALSIYSRSEPTMLQGIKVDVDNWTTAMLIDWFTVLRHTPNLVPQQLSEKNVEQQLHARLTYQGRRAVLSNEKRDFWFWLMQSADVDMARLMVVMIDQPDWREEMPRLAQGLLARQTEGAWRTTVANAWGVAAMEKFSASFESQPVSGVIKAQLNAQTVSMPISDSNTSTPAAIEFPLNSKTSTLKLTQTGSGAPWASVSVFAAVPLTHPRYAGYSIDKSIVPISQKIKGVVSVGDTYRVKLSIEAQSDSNWVVIRDPVAAGVSILGNGLGRDSSEAAQGERSAGYAWPEYTERDFTVYRSYYRFVPRGKFTTEYTIRANNPGVFVLPATRVEAMYAPDIFGESPNALFKIAP